MFKAKMTTDILHNLRKVMLEKTIDAYIVPMDDEHNNEYLAKCDKKIAYLSGFTGSFGVAVVTHSAAVLWTDSRYIEQAYKEVDGNWSLFLHGKNVSQPIWLNEQFKNPAKIGFFKNQMSKDFYNRLEAALDESVKLTKVNECLVSLVWPNRPPRPSNPLVVLPLTATGLSWHLKVDRVREALAARGAACLFLYALDEIAWLFNLRGSDIEYNPVFFSFCVVSQDELHLIIDRCKLNDSPALCQHLNPPQACMDSNYKVTLHRYEKADSVLAEIFSRHRKVWFDPRTNYGYLNLVSECKRLMLASPVTLMKALKTTQEMEAMRQCAIEDAVAMSRFHVWLEETVLSDVRVTEAEAADKLDSFRADLPGFYSLSFATISCSGRNGGMVHYRAQRGFDADVTRHEVYLVDSGGQYLTGGTTDVTRTVHLGNPCPHERLAYTLVLRGHIDLAKAVFPTNTPGSKLDAIARLPLWEAGGNYGHGTGHGVGAFLNVHEGPCGFSGSRGVGDQGILEHMVLTIEPGIYKPGHFGMRIENDYYTEICNFRDTSNVEDSVRQAMLTAEDVESEYLRFVPLTYFPIQTKMVDRSLLTEPERNWLNLYHHQCREKLGNVLRERGLIAESRWLMVETEPI